MTQKDNPPAPEPDDRPAEEVPGTPEYKEERRDEYHDDREAYREKWGDRPPTKQ